MRTIFRTIFLIFTFFIFYQNCDPEFDKYIEILVSSNSISFDNINVNQYSDKNVTIENSSDSDDNLKGDISVVGVGFSIQSGGGTYSLKPGQSKTVTIRFNPTAAQTYSGTLAINHNSENKTSPVNVQLSGTGNSISITVIPSSLELDFGNVTTNQILNKDITITNSSSSASNLSGSVSLSGSGFSVVTGGGSYTLTPGQSKTVTVKFSPTAEQTYNGTLSLTHNATNTSSPVNVSLTGNGEDETIIISVNPTSYDFGKVTVNQTDEKDIIITNSSSSTSNLTGSVSLSGSGFSIVSGDGSYTLTPGQSKTVTVKFSPTADQTYNGTLGITHNATNTSSPVNISLTGNGEPVTDIMISVTPTSYDFGNITVNQTVDKDITIINSSSSTSNLTGDVSLSGSGFSIVTGGGSYTLTPGQSKTVTVKFSPTADQTYNGTLGITHNATNTSSPVNISLTGNGEPVTDIMISVTPTSYDFGNITVNQTVDKDITIINSSSSTSNLTGDVSLSGSGFSIVTGGGSYTLTPGQSKTVTVKFSPTADQTYNGTLSITHNATNTSSPISVPLSGSGASTLIISVAPSSLNYGEVLNSHTTDKTLIMSNSSSSTSNLTGSVSLSGSGFSIITGGGSYTLTPGQSKTVTVRFSPTAAQTYNGTLSITHNATNTSSPISVPLTGAGVTQIVIDVNPTSIDFGTLLTDVYLEKSITISSTNLSTTTLTGNVSISGTYYSISSGEGSFSLQPNQSKEIKIKFTPTQEGTFSGNLSITHNGTNDTSPIDINLTGKRGKAVWTRSTNQDACIMSSIPDNNMGTSSLIAIGWESAI